MQSETPETLDSRPFRVCERCGNLTPTQLPQCAACGAISAQAVVAEEQARAHYRFERAFFSRSTPVTYALLAVNVLMFLLMTLAMPGQTDPEGIIAFGAKTNELLRQGDWFRLVTPVFIHGGLLHLFSNSYALWNVGPQVEKLYGSARYLAIYLLAGIGGVAGSYLGQELTHKGNVPSVGASGAIFGLFGVLAAFGYKYRHELPANFRRAFGAGVLPVIGINLFIGLTIPFIDNGAHVGGLLTGILLTLVIPYAAPGKERLSRIGVLGIALGALLVAGSFFQAYRKSDEHLGWTRKAIGGYLESLNTAERAIVNSLRDLRASGPAPNRAQELSAALAMLDGARAPDPQAEQIRLELRRLLVQLRAPDADREAIARGFEAVEKHLDQWVEQVGSRHGISRGADKDGEDEKSGK